MSKNAECCIKDRLRIHKFQKRHGSVEKTSSITHRVQNIIYGPMHDVQGE